MPRAGEKFKADSTKVSNKVVFELMTRRDRQAMTRLQAEADDDSKNLEIAVDSYDADGFVKTILISIEV